MANIKWERNYNKNYDLSNPKMLNIIIGVLVVIGAVLSGASYYFYTSTTEFLETAKRTEGIVVKLLQEQDGENNSTTYRPVFEFTDESGKDHVIESGTSSNPPAFKKGETVEILYAPASPEDAKINSFFSLWGISLIFGIVGGFFLAFGAVFLFIKKRVVEN